jgi:hypothetical protein
MQSHQKAVRAAVAGTALTPTYWIPALFVMAAAFASCAHITFHDPSDAEHRNVGVEYYRPKLYLLLTKTGSDAYKAEIITLADLSQPRYALLHPGYGSNNLTLKLNNGILTDVGQQTDTKVPETITALGSLATSAGSLAKALAEHQVEPVPGEQPPFRLFEIIIRQGKTKLREVKLE